MNKLIINMIKTIIPESFRVSLDYVKPRKFRFLSLLYSHTTDPSLLFMSKRLSRFKNLYSGKRCFIMGNGPSINRMNLDLFNNELVWGTNRCYILFNEINWRPKFYVAVDKRVVPDNADEINLITINNPETIFFFPSEFRYNRTLKSHNNVFWYYQKLNYNFENEQYLFSANATKCVYSVNTVTIAAIQLAVYLGFNPLYLIGCDTDYSIPNSVIFEKGDPGLLISTDNDPNHFSSDYFGKGKKWHNPNVEQMILHYEQTKEVCDKLGVQIFNATVGGKLEVFPRVNYLELFNE